MGKFEFDQLLANRMKNLRFVIFPLIVSLGFMTACEDSSNTIKNMATELKEHGIFQKNGFRDKEIEVSLSDQAALDLLMKINKLSHDIIVLKLKSYGLEDIYRNKIRDLEKSLRKGGLSQMRMKETKENIKKSKSKLTEETKRLRSLGRSIYNNSIKLKKMKRDFNQMDYAVKF